MKLLIDTHVLLLAALDPDKLRAARATLLEDDDDNEPFFSSASLWEVAIKSGMGKPNFQVDFCLPRSEVYAPYRLLRVGNLNVARCAGEVRKLFDSSSASSSLNDLNHSAGLSVSPHNRVNFISLQNSS